MNIFLTPSPPWPNTKITGAAISTKKGKASFTFVAVGKATGFKCALKKGSAPAVFKPCHSSKHYRSIQSGSYTFEVEALNGLKVDPTPAKKHFRIKR